LGLPDCHHQQAANLYEQLLSNVVLLFGDLSLAATFGSRELRIDRSEGSSSTVTSASTFNDVGDRRQDNRLCLALLTGLHPRTMLLADRGYDAD
jgi:hypothetical protein